MPSSPRSSPTIHVLIDDRERGSRVPDELAAHADVRVSMTRLPLGDYVVDNRLLVERKTLADFALSVLDGRLFRQASRLARTVVPRPCLLMEGTGADLAHCPLSRRAFQGALITLTVVFGLPVLRSRSPAETAHVMLLAAHQLRRRLSLLPCRRGARTFARGPTQALMLQAVPDIGPVKAAALLDAYGSLRALCAASPDDLAAVPGIGNATARRLVEVLGGG